MRFFIFTSLIFITFPLWGQLEETNYRSWTRTEENNGKLALVIGNSKYQFGKSLVEPANDANVIAEALKAHGYEVMLGYNLELDDMYDIVDEFADELENYKEAVFYYAGHGFQVKENNYIIPVDANPSRERQIDRHAINVNYLLQAINQPTIPKLILIDACRNNPFANNWVGTGSRDLKTGMAIVKALKNSLVVFSTAENTKVSDENPFAEIFAKNLDEGGCINNILGKVSFEVQALDEGQLIRPTGIIYPEICFGERTSNSGDSDGDGLLDHADDCPNEYGSVANGGCPVIENNFTGKNGTFIDNRDEQEYKWVRLKDGRIWMAENLNYEVDDSWCYDNDKANCEKYGLLYEWQAAKNACPKGWRLPTDDEWLLMLHYYGGYDKDSNDGGKAAFTALAKDGYSGFSALPSGYRSSDDGSFGRKKYDSSYWSGTEYTILSVWYYGFSHYHEGISRYNPSKKNARSCRCIKE